MVFYLLPLSTIVFSQGNLRKAIKWLLGELCKKWSPGEFLKWIAFWQKWRQLSALLSCFFLFSKIPGYNRSISQSVLSWGRFSPLLTGQIKQFQDNLLASVFSSSKWVSVMWLLVQISSYKGSFTSKYRVVGGKMEKRFLYEDSSLGKLQDKQIKITM